MLKKASFFSVSDWQAVKEIVTTAMQKNFKKNFIHSPESIFKCLYIHLSCDIYLSNKKIRIFLGIKLKYTVFCLIFVLSFLTSSNMAHAFFLINHDADEIKIDHTMIDRSTQDNNFQFYDNFFFDNPHCFLVKKIPGFVSADQVQISIPLKILARNSIYPENSIDRMLLANLRMKKLTTEYLQLQKKARLILQGSLVATIEKPGGKKELDQENGRVDNIEGEKEKINEQLFNIDRLSRFSRDMVSSGDTLFVDGTDPLPETLVYGSASSNGRGKDPDRIKPNIATTRQIFTRSENTELPWVFNFLLKTINYILNNRVEIILDMIFIATIGFFISLKVRK